MSKDTPNDFGFPSLPKTLRDVVSEGAEIEAVNGHIHFSKLGKTIVGKVSDFDINISELNRNQEYLVIFNAEPNSDSRFTVKKVNAYSLRVEVSDPA